LSSLTPEKFTDFFIFHHFDKSSRSDGVRYLLGGEDKQNFCNSSESDQFFSAHIPFFVLGIAVDQNCPVTLFKTNNGSTAATFPLPPKPDSLFNDMATEIGFKTTGFDFVKNRGKIGS
jgi:hypothetical protein